MMKVLSVVSTLFVLALYACGSGGTSTGSTEDQEGQDVLADGEEADVPLGCQTAADCIGKDSPGTCKQVDCIANQCQVVPVVNGTQCDDTDPCSEADQCLQGECEGTPKACSDENACTDDACNPASGQCEFTPNTAPCDDGNLCTSGDACEAGACKGGANVCECTADADCEKYDDGDPCNGVVKCTAGECKVDQATVVDCSKTETGPCEEAYCDSADGACKTKNAADDKPCDDSDKCTTGDLCKAGECKGEPTKCDDGEECTTDLCDPAQGCVFAAVEELTACNDGSLCTQNDVCKSGKCTGEPVPECSGCAADADCSQFEDGDACNGTLKCLEGKCDVDPATVVSCETPVQTCQQNKCNPSTGLCEESSALDGSLCDDFNACTKADYCSGGICKGLPVDCNDQSACTKDACDPDVGCVYTPKDGNCGDGDPCTTNDHCVEGKCVGEPSGQCNCTTDADCKAFEDGDLCNGTLVCKNKKCEVAPATIVDCKVAGLDSCIASTCEPVTGACVTSMLADGADCDDLNACTDADKCYAGTCKGAPKFCDDGNICTDDSCDVNIGCSYKYNTVTCDDGSICSLNDKCANGFCTGDPNPECVCAADADCVPFDDGNKCNGKLVCKAFKCVVDPTSVIACDKSKDTDCLVTYCVPETGKCVQSAFDDGKPCSDKSACTLVDACKGGVCVGAIAPQCMDGNPCTDDACDPALGCIFPFNAAACDDGDPCTGGDTCTEGVCQPGSQDLCGGKSCLPEWTLSCGGTDAWGNDKGDATDIVTKYSCADDTYNGPEYTYSFDAPYDAVVTVSLSNETAETDIIVLENVGKGCDPEQCRTWGYSTVTFEVTAGTKYYFVVDGYEEGLFNGTGTWTINVACTPSHEMVCDDGVDDDQDGLVDCDDPDCQGTEACPLPICSPDWKLECGSKDNWANYYAGSTDLVDEYPSCNNRNYEGPEYTYVFVAPASKTITVRLADETAETDILVLKAAEDGTCTPDNCIAWDFSEVKFLAEAGETYYFVVDGYAGAEGTYAITVECPPDVEGNCEDGIDDDQDGAVDCLDSDCQFAPNCANDCNPWLFPFEVTCGFEENFYNYGFFATDKSDSYSCTQSLMDGPEYVYTFSSPTDAKVTVKLTNESADTRVLVVAADKDGNCVSSNCIAYGEGSATFDAKAGTPYFVVVDGYNGAEGTYTISFGCTTTKEANCTDGVDDDADGKIDCLDSDCFPGPDCEGKCIPDTVSVAKITCNSTDSWSNDGAGSNNVVDYYACNSYYYPAPEYVYTLTVTSPKKVTVKLTNESDDTDVLVLEDTGLGCNPASCLDWGMTQSTFQAQPGKNYYVVVDGYDGATGDYDLTVTCQ